MELLNREQAADYLGCSAESIWRWTKAGKLKALRIGRNLRYRVEDLIAFAERER
jgi:excisionase family DNA binding protein